MSQRYITIRITQECYDKITDAEAVFLKQNRAYIGLNITKSFIIERALNLYAYGDPDGI